MKIVLLQGTTHLFFWYVHEGTFYLCSLLLRRVSHCELKGIH